MRRPGCCEPLTALLPRAAPPCALKGGEYQRSRNTRFARDRAPLAQTPLPLSQPPPIGPKTRPVAAASWTTPRSSPAPRPRAAACPWWAWRTWRPSWPRGPASRWRGWGRRRPPSSRRWWAAGRLGARLSATRGGVGWGGAGSCAGPMARFLGLRRSTAGGSRVNKRSRCAQPLHPGFPTQTPKCLPQPLHPGIPTNPPNPRYTHPVSPGLRPRRRPAPPPSNPYTRPKPPTPPGLSPERPRHWAARRGGRRRRRARARALRPARPGAARRDAPVCGADGRGEDAAGQGPGGTLLRQPGGRLGFCNSVRPS